MSFRSRYKQLNSDQQAAVDTIDGPVMVIAGPGTGKTELLGMRAAAILKKTDVLPENILCLTFTDSGAAAMRQRLTSIIGRDAYKIAVHTFHSFCSDIIGQHRADFYRGGEFHPADELAVYQILRSVFSELAHDNPLAVTMNDEYSYLRDALRTISELKRSGLTSAELLGILDHNDHAIESAEQLLEPIFAERMSKNTAALIAPHIDPIRTLQVDNPLPGTPPLGRVLADSLQQAVIQATDDNSTKPLTSWRNQWFEKNEEGMFTLIARKRQTKLRAVAVIYDQYLARMEASSLFDFDDMILQVVHALEHVPELRFNLQERYHYIMVDEFQDTNLAQLRILTALTDNPVNEGSPNILVVGDDDQAIYSFQGADIGNIVGFQDLYPATRLIRLKENYRSTQLVLDRARQVITQGGDRLELRIPDLDKRLHANRHTDDTTVAIIEAPSASDERLWLVESIKTQLAAGVKATDIVVLARHHRELIKLLPAFADANIAVNYERRENVLDLAVIRSIELVTRIVIELSESHHDHADALLPELLAHPMWNIAPIDIWKLGLQANKERRSWMEVMNETPTLQPLQAWLIETAQKISQLPLEQMLDLIIGKDQPETPYHSPIFDYYFSREKLNTTPDEYLTYLEALRVIRTKLRDYQGNETAFLPDFIEFIDLHRRLGTTIVSRRPALDQPDDAINLMTAHKSKGLEFDTVYIIGSIDTMWGERVRSPSSLIGYPPNLPLAPAGNNYNERLRLYFVAMTRAKRQLFLSYSATDDTGKATQLASFLVDEQLPVTVWSPRHTIETATASAELDWYQPLMSVDHHDMKKLLEPTLQHYRISATHINHFLDVTRGGPQGFLLDNLLRFPVADTPQAAYGRAIHAALQHTHTHLAQSGHERPLEDILQDFEHTLTAQKLTSNDFSTYLQKGSSALQAYMNNRADSFVPTQRAEVNFAGQGVMIGDARLTGAIDVIDVDRKAKQLIVTDYKTGTAARSWPGKADYEKIKLHKYRHQLLFYKLLTERSREFAGYTMATGIIQFVEPTKGGQILALEATFSDSEVEEFERLLCRVWECIVTLDLPDVSGYSQDYKGMVAFEQDLLSA